MRHVSSATFGQWAPSLLGLAVVVASTGIYSILEASAAVATPEGAAYLSRTALLYFATLAAGLGIIAWGAIRFFRRRSIEALAAGKVAMSPTWLLPYILSQGRYRIALLAASLAYGLFYSFLTGIVAFQPSVDFTISGATFPSVLVASCCGPPLYLPSMTVYLTSHLGILLIPLTLILMLLISVLVGMNSALAVFAFDARSKGASRGWVAGVGAAVGLFTGCPTCAGLLFANVLGGAGAVSLATTISSYQPAFIIFSIPVLVATPYLISRSLSKIFAEGCVVVPAR